MSQRDLQMLPRLSDSLSYLYVEHCIVDQSARAIELFDKNGSVLVPAATLTMPMGNQRRDAPTTCCIKPDWRVIQPCDSRCASACIESVLRTRSLTLG